jgi:hypothetical protein
MTMEKVTVYSYEYGGGYDMDQYLNPDQIFTITGVYLHGDLESIVGYDIVYVPILESIDDIIGVPERRLARYNAIATQLPVGIYDVTVKANGSEYEAKAYIYLDTNYSPLEGGKLRGLIVLPEDKDSLAYAVKCYEEKKQCL